MRKIWLKGIVLIRFHNSFCIVFQILLYFMSCVRICQSMLWLVICDSMVWILNFFVHDVFKKYQQNIRRNVAVQGIWRLLLQKKKLFFWKLIWNYPGLYYVVTSMNCSKPVSNTFENGYLTCEVLTVEWQVHMLIYWYRQFNRISIIWKKWLYKSDLLVNAWIGNVKEMVLGSDEIKT